MALTYKESITPYALGRPANMEEWNAITRTVDGQIGFAVPVRASVVPHMCVEVAAGGENVIGITGASQRVTTQKRLLALWRAVWWMESDKEELSDCQRRKQSMWFPCVRGSKATILMNCGKSCLA